VGDRFASLDFPDGVLALSTLGNLLASIWEDIAKRPYITVGFIAFVSMVPLALTSTAGWIRRLGGRNWQRLHRLVYLTGVAASPSGGDEGRYFIPPCARSSWRCCWGSDLQARSDRACSAGRPARA
jgi:hypothetical protein